MTVFLLPRLPFSPSPFSPLDLLSRNFKRTSPWRARRWVFLDDSLGTSKVGSSDLVAQGSLSSHYVLPFFSFEGPLPDVMRFFSPFSPGRRFEIPSGGHYALFFSFWSPLCCDLLSVSFSPCMTWPPTDLFIFSPPPN